MPWGVPQEPPPFPAHTVQRQGIPGTGMSCQSCRNTWRAAREAAPLSQGSVSLSAMQRCVCSSLHSRRAGRSLPAPGTQLQLLTFPVELKLALPTTALKNVLCSSTLNHYFLLCFLLFSPLSIQSPTVQSLFISHWSLCRTSAVPKPGSLRRKFNFL